MTYSTEYFLIEQFLKLKDLVNNASPVFACRVQLEHNCFIYKTININNPDAVNQQRRILAAFKKELNENFDIGSEVFVLNPFAGLHDNVYSIKNPPRKLTKQYVCTFNNFKKILKKHTDLQLTLKNKEIVLSTQIPLTCE